GNGISGIFTAQNIRNLDKEVEIAIYSQEKYPYYWRIKIPELISERISIDKLIVYKEDWYKNNKINTYLGKNVIQIKPNEKCMIIEGEETPITFDKLVLALGSVPNIPPSIKNANKMIEKGVFTLRSINDALNIRRFIEEKNVKKAIIIGGGLLGLELARQIKNCNLDTTVVEFFPRLLPRQLDTECGDMLKDEIERMGIKVVLNAVTEEILVNGGVQGIKLNDGTILNGEMVLIQAGITPTIDVAKDAGIKTNKGILVNQFLETNFDDIFALGDCIEYNNQIYGIIPACVEQSKILASRILGDKKDEYKGTIPKNTLKVVGINLTSIGQFSPPEEHSGGWEILKKSDKKDCCYQKIVLKDNKLKGAILFGETKNITYVSQNMDKVIDKEEMKKLLELYIWKCPSCGWEYDEAEMQVLFKDLSDDFKCVGCGGSKDEFIKKEV
ncbi:MAG: FAD-dependent oxidoreductase, partial [Candidatus Heimdallarchaeota archaeon]